MYILKFCKNYAESGVLKMKVNIRSRAIREKCLDCCNWQQVEVKECTVLLCPLWPWRMGRQPSAEDRLRLEAVTDDRIKK